MFTEDSFYDQEKGTRMKSLCTRGCSLIVALALATGGVYWQPLSQENVEKNRSTTDVNISPDTQADIVFAIVTAIDHRSGLVVLDSVMGRLMTIATSTQLHDLHTGDLVLVHLSRENGQRERQQVDKRSKDTLI
jgi:hypothetical protein